MKNLSKVSTPKKVLFIGLGILAVGIVVLAIGLLQSAIFQCAYNLGRNNSSLTQDQISKYCNNNNQILRTENREDLITIGFGSILIVTGLIITSTGGIWLIVRRGGGKRIEASSSSGVSLAMINNNRQQQQEDYRFTPKKVLI